MPPGGPSRARCTCVTTALYDELLRIAPLPAVEAPAEVERTVDALVRTLVADGLSARRTGPDRLEARFGPSAAMEWCWLGDLVIGRPVEDRQPAAWTHRVEAGNTVAIWDVGRAISRAVRADGGLPTS
jgi:hypothetical protein